MVLAFQFGLIELGFFALYLVARVVERERADGKLSLSTLALWSMGVGMLLTYTRSHSWASAAEVAVVLFGMGAARVGRRTHPARMVWVLGLVGLVAHLPLVEVCWFLLHGALACLLLGLAWTWVRTPDSPEQTLAEKLDGHFDLETRELRIAKGDGDFVSRLSPGPRCTGPLPRRVAHADGAITLRACDCRTCRSYDPKGETRTTCVEVDGQTVTIVHRGFEPLVHSAHHGELRALLRELTALPHGKAIAMGGEMSVRAGAPPREVRAEGSRTAAEWSVRVGEQVVRLTFAFYDFLDGSDTQAYR